MSISWDHMRCILVNSYCHYPKPHGFINIWNNKVSYFSYSTYGLTKYPILVTLCATMFPFQFKPWYNQVMSQCLAGIITSVSRVVGGGGGGVSALVTVGVPNQLYIHQ